jgi:predicted CXXCH cytochrome family protein
MLLTGNCRGNPPFLCTTCVVLLLTLSPPVEARVTGQCANCHTMHNSQNGAALARTGDGIHWGSGNQLTGGVISATAWDNLLVSSCVGCHSSSTADSIVTVNGSVIPIVFNTTGYPDHPLAGGNFYHVSQGGGENDVFGHNVEGIAEPDSNLEIVPGQEIGGNSTLAISDCLACHLPGMSGVPGIPFTIPRSGNVLICQDCHTVPNHHADDSATVVGEDGGWYRFLFDVKGIEDDDWEKTISATDHNEYQGGAFNSVSRWGCGCHSQFHALANPGGVGVASPWLRHPVDVILPDAGEYAAYTQYSPEAPVARPDLTGYSGPSSTVTPGTDMVMCLSCHRPHGSPYKDILRWDYDEMIAGDSSKSGGCFTCHSHKN